MGRPAGQIAAIAEAHAADLIVMGKRSHGVMDRVRGDETTLQVMRTSRIPVLAVPGEIGRAKTIVVATDFSDASERAAKIAHALIPASGTLYLAHVESSVVTVGETLTDGGRYPGDVVVWFRRLMDDLPSRAEVSIHPMLLNGNAPGAIMELAERVGADVIAVGSHGRNRLERFLLGSVSTGLVREARCAVLVAPPV
jgi:nucleotide-binding universal stress UspA family protein